MKLKQITMTLSDLTHHVAFPSPNIQLEQYPTSPALAAHLAFAAYNNGDIVPVDSSEDEDEDEDSPSGSTVLDLGCGTGILGIASIAVGASHVTAFECDASAIEVARANYERMEMEDMVTFVEGTLSNEGIGEGGDGVPFPNNSFSCVFTNPPFGTKNNSGIDVAFLRAACRIATVAVYSFHKTSTREYLLKKITEEWGLEAEIVAEMKFEVKNMYKFHKKKR